mmetsp:Transcript_15733/g.30397  ORF Transcript_15733/g.30397 Transcript_15733/m.30397 type:complete len:243 (-) Transcript_15733:466-1194(-)|eukprot:CAMPEP_0171502878 /NCGR_PEP_ID=MMETSP0958-20121227/10487_1 /TAXON_ID=87120 /ORGANISM="Aurantiochytrium limacinum, Strain ATCCMYA-1381" /LENGTH=242 /DNA_ID=CAMNT_0012038111 /DNA_START=578 /DNA_END=1306 /DNA_ORIENTATION=+
MYFIAVLVNIAFCIGLTLQMFMKRSEKTQPFVGVDGGDPTRAKMLREAQDRVNVLQSAVRKEHDERRSVHRKLEEERRVRDKLRSKLEEERLLRANLQSKIRTLQTKLNETEKERDSLQSIVSLLCANTGALESLVSELRSAKTNLTPPNSGRENSPSGAGNSSTSNNPTSSDARSHASLASVDSQASLLMMKSCASYDSSRYQTSSSNASVRTDEFFEPGSKQSDLYNAFETESDSESLSN